MQHSVSFIDVYCGNYVKQLSSTINTIQFNCPEGKLYMHFYPFKKKEKKNDFFTFFFCSTFFFFQELTYAVLLMVQCTIKNVLTHVWIELEYFPFYYFFSSFNFHFKFLVNETMNETQADFSSIQLCSAHFSSEICNNNTNLSLATKKKLVRFTNKQQRTNNNGWMTRVKSRTSWIINTYLSHLIRVLWFNAFEHEQKIYIEKGIIIINT